MLAAAAGSSRIERMSSSVSGQNPNAAVCSAATSANTSATCAPVAGSTVNPAGSPAGSRTDMRPSVTPGSGSGNRIPAVRRRRDPEGMVARAHPE